MDGTPAPLCTHARRGKNSPAYHPAMDMGAYVVVINAEKVTVTGSKFDNKTYFNHYTSRPGSYHLESFKDLQRVGEGCAGCGVGLRCVGVCLHDASAGGPSAALAPRHAHTHLWVCLA